MKIHDINDHMAYTHSCGSAHFNLLRSGRIECAGCGELLEHTVNYETKTYSDGTTATGVAPLPPRSPAQQDEMSGSQMQSAERHTSLSMRATVVDCLGLALELESQAKRVESKSAVRAMYSAARGLRLMGEGR